VRRFSKEIRRGAGDGKNHCPKWRDLEKGGGEAIFRKEELSRSVGGRGQESERGHVQKRDRVTGGEENLTGEKGAFLTGQLFSGGWGGRAGDRYFRV